MQAFPLLRTLIFETSPADPTRPESRQGDTLGRSRKHGFRAAFGNGRFRPFFRFDSRAKGIIIVAWVNDETTLRTYGSRTGADHVFRGMLAKGNPPDDWTALLAASSATPVVQRLDRAGPAQTPRGTARPCPSPRRAAAGG